MACSRTWIPTLLLLALGCARDPSANDFLAQGRQLAAEGKHAAAVDRFTRALTADPSLSGTYVERAESLTRLEEWSRAAADLTEAMKGNNDPALVVARGKARRRQGERDTALEDFQSVATNAAAPAPLREEAAGEAGALLAEMADAQLRAGRFHGAVDRLDQAAAIDPKRFTDYQTNKGRVYLARGRQQLTEGHAAAAIDDFSEAVERRIDDADAFFLRAVAHVAVSRPNDAINDYELARMLSPEETFQDAGLARVLADLATQALEKSDLEQAVTRFDHALRTDPEPGEPLRRAAADAHCRRGERRLAARDWPGAMADFEAAIQWHAMGAAGFKGRGRVLREQGRLVDSIADFTRALQLAPSDAELFRLRALARYSRPEENPRDVIADLQRWIDLEPRSAQAHAMLAAVLLRVADPALRDVRRSIALAKTACELSEHQDYEALLVLGTALRETGDETAGQAYLTRAIELAPAARRVALRDMARHPVMR